MFVNEKMSIALVVLTALAMPHAVQAENKYLQHNLVSDLPGLADHVDANLVNPWGMAASPTSPLWVVNNHSGKATVYDSTGKNVPLVVAVPASAGTSDSSPTGQVFNGTTSFVLNNAKPALFLFCTEDGTISGWYSGIDGNKAAIAVNHSGDVYKGMAMGMTDSGPVLYVANFSAGRVDVFGADFASKTLAGNFSDPSLPAGFAPFNIYTTGGKVFVAYAKQDDEKGDDVPGNGNGYINVFDLNGRFQQRLVTGGHLNSPWGMAIAPDTFGDFAKALLVGNFGDGTINAYNATTGEFLGTLQDANGKPLVIAGLWALQFGNGGSGGDAAALYFTAGISGPNGDALESHGLLGTIQAAPAIRTDGVVNAASLQKGIAPNTWVSIFGTNLAATTRTWQDSDFQNNRLPTALDAVTVTIGGKPAYVSYISPTQLNVLTPSNLGPGDVDVQVTSGGLAGNTVKATAQLVSPALFQSTKYAVAIHSDGKSVVSPTAPAQPGEILTLYGTGFGPTDPPTPEGTLVTTPLALAHPAEILIGGKSAQIQFQGLTSTGLYQFNVQVPDALPAGETPIVAQSAGTRSPDGVFTSLDAPAAPPMDYVAQINNFQFLPDPVNVASGSKLTWTNQQGVEHTVVSDTGQFHSPVIGQNGTFSFTFTAPGTYAYHCSIHPFMKGQVVVK